MKYYIIRIFEKFNKTQHSFIGYYGGSVVFLGKYKNKTLFNIVQEKDLAMFYDKSEYNIMYKDMKILEKKFKKYYFELDEISVSEGE